MAKPIPSRRLDKQIRQAVLQYNWDGYGIGDLYDPDKEETVPASHVLDDPLLRIVLLCRARSPEWPKVLKKALTHADLQHYHQRRPRHIVANTPDAKQTRQGLYQEMASRLINPVTMQPVDLIGMSNRLFAREVADGAIQLRYVEVTRTAAFPEEL
jgi:hypothetical protein